jgi:hypothetical protein
MSLSRVQTTVAAVYVALALGGLDLAAQKEFSSANRSLGRAAVEYKDPHVQAVAAYYYSQRNHDSRWLMIEAALSTTAEQTFKRSDISLITPEGREVPLATQKMVGDDSNRISALLQNSRVLDHDVLSYFRQSDRTESMKLFTLPFGGVVHDSFVVDRDRVAAGRLFFASPTGAWARGTYALVIRHTRGAAEIPINLE